VQDGLATTITASVDMVGEVVTALTALASNQTLPASRAHTLTGEATFDIGDVHKRAIAKTIADLSPTPFVGSFARFHASVRQPRPNEFTALI